MIDYQQDDRTQQRLVGAVATFAYGVLVVALLLLMKFQLTPPPDTGEGLMINFGDVAEAAPGADMAMNDRIAEAPQQPQQPTQKADVQQQQTQDFEETDVEVKKQEKPQPKKQQTVKKETPKPKPTQTPAEKPREVNRKALFPGRTSGSTSTSDGTGVGTGNQGNPAGSPSGSYKGTGTGTGGNSASLSGRSLLGSLPRPDYSAKDQGRVIIAITVDQQGRVTRAAYRPQGSTTSNSSLVASAVRAAQQARFNVDEDAPASQTGTITYNFKMQ